MNIVVSLGGSKTVCAARLGVKVAEFLQGQGHQVSLFAPKGKGDVFTSVAVKEYTNLTTTKKLADMLAKSHTDMLVSVMNLRTCEAAMQAKVPFIYVEYENFKEDKPVKTKKALLQKAARVLVLGSDDKPLAKAKYGANAQRVTEPAVWVEHYNYDKPTCFKKENNILAVGPLTKESGFDTLLQTWARLAPAHKTWHLTIVGDGTQKSTLQKFIAKHNLQDSTEIVPAKSDIYSFLRNADIFAYPALNPAHADILLDAMASKLPCVACESAAVTELITNGVNGVIVNAGEEEPFTIALDDLMVNWGKRVGMAVEASKHKDRYPFAAFMQAVCALLK
ncbi:glycosyltransferase [Candidatus Avelusimicrobium luingense]|uniref:glycosyltransferase n=1 Tax=Candidatus Avelusimicrobium luingense TaxID=3416211 RepID=UPI003D12B97F